ncbi:MAG: PAS domain S-box protein [Methylocystaceae bacterium]
MNSETIFSLPDMLQDLIPDGLCIINRQQEIKAWNRAMVTLTGISQSEALGIKAYLLSTPLLNARPGLDDLILGSRPELSSSYDHLQIDNGIYSAELNLADGRTRYLARAVPLYQPDGSIDGVMLLFQYPDQSREELDFREMIENLEDMLYRIEFVPSYHFSYLSPALSSIIGMETHVLYDDFYQVLSYVHPDDHKALLSIFYGRVPKTILLRWHRPDGVTAWLEVRVVPIVNCDDIKVGLQGIVRDLTDRIHIEEELRGANEELEASFQQLSCLEEELRQQYDELEITQSRLAISERRYRTLLENVNLITLMLDKSGRITFVNDFLTTATGWAYQNLLGYTFGEILVADYYRRRWYQHFSKTVLNTREGNYFSVPLKTKLGDTRIINFSQTQLYDETGRFEGIALIGEDITERETVRQALEKSELNFREIMDNLADLICKTDRHGRVVYLSPSHLQVFGTDLETMSKMTLEDFIYPDDIPDVIAALKRVLRAGKATTVEVRCRHVSDSYLWVETVASPLFDDNGICGAVLSSRNINDRKLLEDELRYVGLHDVLTGLYNRTYFEEEMNRLSDGRLSPIGVFVIDVDGLKLVNDSLGHEKGDLLLYRAGEVIKKCFRQGDVVARVGGDEFAALLPCCDQTQMEAIRQRLSKALGEYNEQFPELPLSISVGMAMHRQIGQLIRELYKEADNDMYRDKLQRSRSARSALVQTLMTALEARDYITEGHAERLQILVSALATKLGLPTRTVGDMKILAQFHDIGKVGIPDRILFKPGALDPEEYAEMQRHCEIGSRIALASPELAPLSDLILKHHEWWNGCGYPLGVKGEEIPLPCRILAVADAFDAMTNDRPYRKAMSVTEAQRELEAGAGTQFDPELVKVFCTIIQSNGITN